MLVGNVGRGCAYRSNGFREPLRWCFKPLTTTRLTARKDGHFLKTNVMTILVVNNNRYLINDKSPVAERVCKDIIASYPHDAVVEFDSVRPKDIKR